MTSDLDATIHLVTGRPCSGKSTYVAEHKADRDLVIDYDTIAVALGSPDSHDHPKALVSHAIHVRDSLLTRIASRPTAADVWIVACDPTPRQHALADEVILLDTPAETCKARAIQAGRPAKWAKLIDTWTPTDPPPATQQPPAGQRRARRNCIEPGCPALINAGQTRCHDHERAKDKARGTSTERGYDANHQRGRARWQKRMDAGETVTCWRCGEPIDPDPSTWDYGHDPHDRTKYRGPEHLTCNRGAGRVADADAFKDALRREIRGT